MNLNTVSALLYRDFLILSRVKWRLAETFYFPINYDPYMGAVLSFHEEFLRRGRADSAGYEYLLEFCICCTKHYKYVNA